LIQRRGLKGMKRESFEKAWKEAVEGNKKCFLKEDRVAVCLGQETVCYADRFKVDPRPDNLKEELKGTYLYLGGNYVAQIRIADVTEIGSTEWCSDNLKFESEESER